MKYILKACLLALLQIGPAAAQVETSDETNRVISAMTEALFDLLPSNDFDAEYRYLTPAFAASISLAEWKKARSELVEITGSTPRYSAHQLTFYQQDTLLAAVDFSGKVSNPEAYICGFVLWDFYASNEIGLLRLEQNVVSVEVFNSMPKQQAAQLMADFHCPVSLIESVLQISLE